MNSLCQDDEYSVTVIFGTQPNNMVGDCSYELTNITVKVMEPFSQINISQDILLGDGEEYCYRAVLSDEQGRAIDGMDASYIVLLTINNQDCSFYRQGSCKFRIISWKTSWCWCWC